MPIGICVPVGQVEHRGGPAATPRLVTGKVELEGRPMRLGRGFIRPGGAVEEL